jgi:hypothetical protein
LRAFGWLGVSELAITYALNVALLVFACWTFRKLLDSLSIAAPERFGDVWSRAAAWALLAWVVIRLMSVASVTPDILAAALFFQATALIARRVQGPLPARDVAVFGTILGAAYAAKAVMFVAAVVMLVAYAWVAFRKRGPHSTRRELAGALAAFAVIAAPLVAIQSNAAGHLTFGETGRLNYARFVNNANPNIPPAGVVPNRGETTGLASVPGARLYVDSLPGTFPHWYDPARWSTGIEARFDATAQWQVLRGTTRWYRAVAGLPFLIVLVFVAVAIEARRKAPRPLWPLLAAPVALLSAYALVHVEGRLTGAPIVLVLVVLLAMADADDASMRSHSRELLYAGLVAFGLIGSAQRLATGPRLGDSRNASIVSNAIQLAGVPSGSDVAAFGWPPDYGIYWAHVAGVRIVTTIPTAAAAGLTPAAMTSLITEACGLGRTIRAVVGRDSAWARAGTAQPLGDGWFVWLPAPPRGECR